MPTTRTKPISSPTSKVEKKTELPKPATQPKVSKKTAPSSPIKKRVLDKVFKEADISSRETKAKINSQISQMGNRPIALVATHSVLKGIDLEKSKDEKQVKEAKISINTEILKKAMIKELKMKKAKGKRSPTKKSPDASPTKAKKAGKK